MRSRPQSTICRWQEGLRSQPIPPKTLKSPHNGSPNPRHPPANRSHFHTPTLQGGARTGRRKPRVRPAPDTRMLPARAGSLRCASGLIWIRKAGGRAGLTRIEAERRVQRGGVAMAMRHHEHRGGPRGSTSSPLGILRTGYRLLIASDRKHVEGLPRTRPGLRHRARLVVEQFAAVDTGETNDAVRNSRAQHQMSPG